MRSKTASARGIFTLFLVAFLLPVMFFLLTLSLDLTTYYLDAAKTQDVVDESARYAYRFLPLQAEAESAARSYAGRFGTLTDGLTVRVSSDWIELHVQRQSPLTFARLLGFTSGTLQEGVLPIEVISRVRGVPLDAMIVMDVSPYLAPSIYGNNAWGNPGEWPAAQYMQNAWWFDPSGAPVPNERGLTQQCFNPVFSALKRATIGTFEFLSGFAMNQVGVGFYTGRDLEALVVARSPSALSSLPAASSNDRETAFVEAIAPYSDNRYCAAAAQEEINHPDYNFPTRLSGLGARRETSPPVRLIEPVAAAVNPEYLDFLETREVIWSQIARGDNAGNSPALFSALYAQMLSAPVLDQRGGLIDKASKVGIIFAGDLPRLGGARFGDSTDGVLRARLQAEIARFLEITQSANIKSRMRLYYVVLQNQNLAPLGSAPQALQSFFSEIIAAHAVPPDQFDIKVIAVSESGNLVQAVLKALVLTNSISVQSL